MELRIFDFYGMCEIFAYSDFVILKLLVILAGRSVSELFMARLFETLKANAGVNLFVLFRRASGAYDIVFYLLPTHT